MVVQIHRAGSRRLTYAAALLAVVSYPQNIFLACAAHLHTFIHLRTQPHLHSHLHSRTHTQTLSHLQGMAVAVLMATTAGDGSILSLGEKSAGPSAAQVELRKWERKWEIQDSKAYSTVANTAKSRVAHHDAFLRDKARASAQEAFEAEAKRGVLDPDAAPHRQNILDLNAKRSDEVLRRVESRKLGEEDRGKNSITKYLQGATTAVKAAAQITERPLPSILDTAHERYLKKEAEHKAAEKAFVEKEEAARLKAQEVAEKGNRDEIIEATARAKKEDDRKAASQHSYEETQSGEARTVAATPKTTAPHDDINGVTIVKGTVSAVNAAPSTSDDEKHVSRIVKRGSTSDSKKDDAAQPKPGMLCLSNGGLSDQELDDFSDSTVCVGWEIKRNMGLGDTVHMMKDFLDAPMNRKKIMHCVAKLNPKVRIYRPPRAHILAHSFALMPTHILCFCGAFGFFVYLIVSLPP